MTNKEDSSKQAIVQLILRWKLSTAEVQLQKDQAILSEETRAELKSLLDQYRGYDKIMFSAQENCDKNPATTRMMMNRIPNDILITHPSYRKISSRLQKNDGSKPHSKKAPMPNTTSEANSARSKRTMPCRPQKTSFPAGRKTANSAPL